MIVFGITTSIFGARRLRGADLADVARCGLSTVELTAAPGHFSLDDAAQVSEVVSAAAGQGLQIAAVSTPPETARDAVSKAIDAGWPLVVLRMGVCKTRPTSAWLSGVALGDLLARLIDEMPSERPLRVAVELPPASRLSAGDLLRVVESLESPLVGVSLDFGHAHMGGSVAEAAETLSGYVLSTHLHDNNGREDSHRLPFGGGIDWPEALTACWKTGYLGPWILDPAAESDPAGALQRLVGSRGRLQAILEDLSTPIAFTE